jgi:hypothetical protein
MKCLHCAAYTAGAGASLPFPVYRWRRRRGAVQFRAHHERVAIRVLEDRGRPPRLLLRRLHELDSALHHRLVRLLDVIAAEREVHEGANPVLVAGRREEGDAGLGGGDAKLDPPLAAAHGLVGHELKAHDLLPEGERAILITNRDANELDPLEHGSSVAATTGVDGAAGSSVRARTRLLWHGPPAFDEGARHRYGRCDVALAIVRKAIAMPRTLALDAHVVDALLPSSATTSGRQPSFCTCGSGR